MGEQEKRYAAVGDLVIHKRSGEMGIVAEVHAPNEYPMAGRPVSCPVVVLESGAAFLDVPGKTMFDFLPHEVLPAVELLRGTIDACVSDAAHGLHFGYGIDEYLAMLIVGSIIRERLRKEK